MGRVSAERARIVIADVLHAAVEDKVRDIFSSRNIKHFKFIAFWLPKCFHWLQSCESHAANPISMRPFINSDIITNVFCYSKLCRLKSLRNRIHRAI